jgi:hypothetical protein
MGGGGVRRFATPDRQNEVFEAIMRDDRAALLRSLRDDDGNLRMKSGSSQYALPVELMDDPPFVSVAAFVGEEQCSAEK